MIRPQRIGLPRVRHGESVLWRTRKTEVLPSQQLTGVWCWQRRVQRQLRKRRSKNFAGHTGDQFMVSCGGKALRPKKQKISLRVFLHCCWNGEISMLSARRKDACVLIC